MLASVDQPFNVRQRIPGVEVVDKAARVRLLIERREWRGIPWAFYHTTPGRAS
jgi:hypothetical protein